MEPEEDFETWATLIVMTIEPNGDYIHLLPGFERLLQSYCEDGMLPPPLEGYTTQFAESTLPGLFNGILSLDKVTGTFAQTNIAFLCRSVGLLTRGTIKGIFNCSDCLLSIFDGKRNFYRTNYEWSATAMAYKYVYLEAVGQALMQGPLDELLDSTQSDITLERIMFIGKLLGQSTAIVSQNRECLAAKLVKPLEVVFGGIDSKRLRDIDEKVLSEVCRCIGLLMTSITHNDDLVRLSLEFGGVCLKSGFLNKEVIGAKLLNRMAAIDNDVFKEWCVQSKIGDYLLKETLNEKVIEALGSCTSAIFGVEQLSVESLVELYNKAEHVHSSQKGVMNSFLTKALDGAAPEVVCEFLDAITKPENVTEDLIGFLSTFLTYSRQRSNYSEQIAKFLVTLIDSDRDIDFISASVDNMLKYSLPEKAQKHIFSVLLERFPDLYKYTDKITCYKRLTVSLSTIPMDEKIRLMGVLIDGMKQHPEHQICYLSFLKTILMRSQATLPAEAFPYLINSEESWAIFSKLLLARGLTFIDPVSMPELFPILDRLDHQKTTQKQFEVLKLVILSYAQEQKKIHVNTIKTNTTQEFKVTDPFVDGLEFVVEVFQKADSEDVSSQAKVFLLELFTGVTQVHYNAFAKRMARILLAMNFDDQRTCSRNLSLVNAFISNFERFHDVQHFGIQRHKMFHRSFLTLHIKYGTETIDVQTRPHYTPHDLSKILAYKLRKKRHYCKFALGREALPYNEPMSLLGVTNGSVLTCQSTLVNDPDFPVQCMTSILAKNEVIENAYKLIQRDDLLPSLKRSVWKFLMFMPTAASVSELVTHDEEFAKCLKNAANEMQLRYLIQTAQIENVKAAASAVLGMLTRDEISTFTLFDALTIVKGNLVFESPDDVVKFCRTCLRILGDQELTPRFGPTVIDLLLVIVTEYPNDVCSAFLHGPVSIGHLVCMIDPLLLKDLSQVFARLTGNRREVLQELMSSVHDLKDDTYRISEYFNIVTLLFDDSCDVDAAITFALELLTQRNQALFDGICKFLHFLFSQHPDVCQKHVDLFDVMLQYLFESTVSTTQESILSILQIFSKEIPELRDRFRERLMQCFSVVVDRWGYDPSSNRKSSTGFAGLRNMGATCYMNSVFQQLFSNPTFRSAIIKGKPEKDWQIAFRSIFARLLLTDRPFVDTQPFVSTWKFYGDEVVNPKMQQDAGEFLLLLLDRIGDVCYKGEIANIMLGVDESDGFERKSSEVFFTIPLVVLGQKSFDDSLTCFLEKETMTGYNAESLGKRIDIVKFSRVRKAPDFLILQLKRFEYNLTTWQRYKVNDKFEFPTKFDLSRLMEDESQHSEYTLTGMVIHNGTAEGGHYTSYVKVGEKWYYFDDTNVTEASQTTVMKDAVGGKYTSASYEHYPSAYMLFYAKSELVCEKETIADLREYLRQNDTDLTHEIEKENKEFLAMQVTFSTAFINYLMTCDDIEMLMSFFFNVFAHSHLTAQASKFANHVIGVIQEQNAANLIMSMFVEKSRDLFNVFMSCTTSEITEALSNLLRFLIDAADKTITGAFINKILDELPHVTQNWRIIHHFLEPLVQFCGSNSDFVEENKIIDKLLTFVEQAFTTKSSVYIQSVNFTSILLFFQDRLQTLGLENIKRLQNLSLKFLEGTKHSEIFVQFMKECARQGLVQMDDFVDSLLGTIKDKASPHVLFLLLQLGSSGESFRKLIDNPRVSKDELTETISRTLDGGELELRLRESLLSNPSILFALITCNNARACDTMEAVYLALFPEVSSLVSWPRAEEALGAWYEYCPWEDEKYPVFAEPGQDHYLRAACNAMIEGLAAMNANPSLLVCGCNDNTRLTHMIRVLFWAILRTRMELTLEQSSIIIQFVRTLRNTNVIDNCNMIEFIRVVGLIPMSCHKLFEEKFEEIVEAVFTLEYNEIYHARNMMFCVFFEGLTPLWTRELLERLQTIPVFVRAFANTPALLKEKEIRALGRVVIKHKPDLSGLAAANFDSLIMAWPSFGLCLIALSTSLEVTNEMYTKFISAAVSLYGAMSVKAATRRTEIEVINSGITRLSVDHDLTDISFITPDLEPFVNVLYGDRRDAFIDFGVNLGICLCEKSQALAEAFLAKIQSLRSSSCATATLELRVIEILGKDNTVKLESIKRAVNAVEYSTGRRHLLCEFRRIFERHEVYEDKDWMHTLFKLLVQCGEEDTEYTQFWASFLGQFTDDEIVDLVGDATQQAWAIEDVLPTLRCIVGLRKDLRQRILESSGITEEVFATERV